MGQVAAGGHIALQVHPEGCALGAGAGEAQHHTAAIVEQQPQALAAGEGAIHRVGVGEIVGGGDAAAPEGLAHQGGLHGLDAVVEAMGRIAGDGLIVVAGVVVAPKTAPVLRHDLAHRLAAAGQDVEPEQHGPQPILFTDVVGAGAEALLTAEGDAPRIQQVAEEFPAGGGFEAGDAQLVRHHIGRSAGGHGAGHPRQAMGIAGHQGGIGGEHRQAVAGVHEAVLPQDHVAVAITITGGPKAVAIALEQQIRQLVGVGEVGVGMAATEILQGGAVAHAAGRCAQ